MQKHSSQPDLTSRRDKPVQASSRWGLRLQLGLVGLSILTFFSLCALWLSPELIRIQEDQERIGVSTIPYAQQQSRLATQTSRVATVSRAMGGAASLEELDRLATEAGSALEQLELAMTLARPGTAGLAFNESQQVELLESVGGLQEALLSLVSTRRRFLVGRDALRASLQEGVERLDRLDKRLGLLVVLEDGPWESLEVLKGTRSFVEQLGRIGGTLLLQDQVEGVLQQRDSAQLAMRGASSLVPELPANERVAIADELARAYPQIVGGDSWFDQAVAVLESGAEAQERAEGVAEVAGRVDRITKQRSRALEALAVTLAADTANRSATILRVLFFLALLFILFVLGAFALAERAAVRPLRALIQDMTRLTEGNLRVPIRVGGHGEFGELSRVAEKFRENAEGLEAARDEVAERNRDLNEFAHVASHDLKSPLRAVQNLAEWVEQDAGDVLPEESKAHLQLLRSRAHSMENLLEDLLRYASMGNVERNRDELDLLEMVGEVVSLLPESEVSRVQVCLGIRRLRAPRAPLLLILRNTISNSIQHAVAEELSIQVVFDRDEQGRVVVEVRDNGPGIPSGKEEIAFGLFRTLEHRTSGTGMGLPLAKRAAESLGGFAELLPVEPQGLAFRATLVDVEVLELESRLLGGELHDTPVRA